jgi:hypothetical protein
VISEVPHSLDGYRWAVLGTAAVGLVALALTGHPLAAVVPVVSAFALYLLSAARLQTLSRLLIALLFFAESPEDRPAAGLWVSPLEWLGRLMLGNLNQLSGVRALSFSLFDLLAGGVVLCLLLRRYAGLDRGPFPRALERALVSSLLALIALAIYGLVRGGNASATYWHLRQLAWLPALSWIAGASAQTSAQVRALGKVVIAAAVVKTLVGLYFYLAICLPGGLHPAYVTTHSDTVHFVLALAIGWIAWVEQPTPRALRFALGLTVLVGAALVLNARRVAWVELPLVLATAWAFAPRAPGRRKMTVCALVSAPLIFLYGAFGWDSEAALFRPVHALRTMADSKGDSSTHYREVENFDLARTFAAAPVFGGGFGHPYLEVVHIEDISRDYEFYKYIPHNSLLGLLAVGGLVGFCVVLSPLVVSVYLASAAWTRSDPEGRIAALSAIAGVFAFLLQAFGDMGTQSWSTVGVLATSIAVSGRQEVPRG